MPVLKRLTWGRISLVNAEQRSSGLRSADPRGVWRAFLKFLAAGPLKEFHRRDAFLDEQSKAR